MKQHIKDQLQMLATIGIALMIAAIGSITSCIAKPPDNAKRQTCYLPEKYMLRPTDAVYRNNRLYFLGQSNTTFGSLDLKTCRYHYITGGKEAGFVLPMHLFYSQPNQEWLITDPASGIIKVKNGKAQGFFGNLDPVSNVARIDKNTLAVVEAHAAAVYKINEKTAQSALLSNVTHGKGPLLYRPYTVTSHAGNLYVLDYRLKAIFRVDPHTGNRKIFARLSQFRNNGVLALQPFAITAGDYNFYVTDPQAHQVIAVSYKTHQATVFSSNQTQQTDRWVAPYGISFDRENHRLFVTDYADNAIYEIPTNTYQPKRYKIVASKKTAPHLVFPAQLKLSEDGNLIIGDERAPGIFELNAYTHKLRLLSGPDKGSGPTFTESVGIDTLEYNGVIFDDTYFDRFYVVDSQGDRYQMLPPLALTNRLGDPWGMVPADTPNSWYVSDGGWGKVFKVTFDFTKHTQQQQLIAETPTIPGCHSQRCLHKNLLGITKIDKNRLIVSNQTDGSLLTINPNDGKITVFSGLDLNQQKTRGTGPQLRSPAGIGYLPGAAYLYVIDSARPALFRVNLNTGNRQIVSGQGDKTYIGSGPKPTNMASLVLIPQADNAYVSDARGDAIYLVDLNNGNRQLVYKYQN